MSTITARAMSRKINAKNAPKKKEPEKKKKRGIHHPTKKGPGRW